MRPFKKTKTNPSSAEPTSSDTPSTSSKTPAGGATQPAQDEGRTADADQEQSTAEQAHAAGGQQEGTQPAGQQQKSLNAKSSWIGGTWPRTPAKAAPVTQIARESISSSGDPASRAAQDIKAKAESVRSVRRAPSLYMSSGVSTRSLPSTGTATKVSISTSKLGHTESHDGTESDPLDDSKHRDTDGKNGNQATETPRKDQDAISTKSETAAGDGGPWGMSSWIPTFGRGQALPSKPVPATAEAPPKETTVEGFNPSALSADDATSSADKQATEAREAEDDAEKATQLAGSAPQNTTTDTTSRPKSWFGLWNGESSMKGPPSSEAQEDNDEARPGIDTDLAIRAAAPRKTQDLDSGDNEQTPEESAAATSVALAEARDAAASGSVRSGRWSWWARTQADQLEAKNVDHTAEPTGSKNNPESKDTEMAGTETPNSTASRKRERPTSSELPNGGREDKISKQSADGKTSATAAVNVLPDDGTTKVKGKNVRPVRGVTNLLLPSLKQTYRAAETPGLLERLAQYFFTTKTQVPKHANLVKEPPRIKRAIAIGVHGYFPTPLIRTVIGQPKGTSVRFATKAAEAIHEWCAANDCRNVRVDKIVLEGEGKIAERVELLWQLLIKQVELIREADFTLVACHSQGVPVAIQLVAKLIDFGVLVGKKVGICAMAGVNLGPFIEYKSRWIGGSAGELFDFASSSSQVSTNYETALSTVLKTGIKVCFVGSIDDQLVSLESATFGCADHPGLFRAVFINGQVHAPTFVVHLVGFALKLRNLGVPDHGLIRELSNSLAGSFTGDGHSRLYEDPALYDLAVEFALETTPVTDVPLNVRRNASPISKNPYILPFAMRGVLEEKYVKSDLHDEMNELLSQFDEWEPATKPLQDVKFRLEGVKSKI